MPDKEKVIEEMESLRDICNARSDMSIGKGKIAWAGYANTVIDAIDLLKEQPEMKKQPEIVRCKDCVFRKSEENDSTGTMRISCKHRWGAETKDDWFCADGERRTE